MEFKVPGFTAERSAYRSRRRYTGRVGPSIDHANALLPQNNCGACVCKASATCHQDGLGCWCTPPGHPFAEDSGSEPVYLKR